MPFQSFQSGFRMTFANGWSVSVQFSTFNYCDNQQSKAEKHFCTNAETALIDPKHKIVPYNGEDVQGWQTPEQVAALIAFAAAKV